MADNVELNPASGGATISTDEVGGVQVQRVKMQIGADGAASDVHSGNPLPVTGTVAATLSEPISVDDNGSTLSVDDGGATLSIDDGGGSVTVDGSVAVSSLPALAAGTNNIGDVDVLTLPALPAGTNNIGDVDVLTLPTIGQLPASLVSGRLDVNIGAGSVGITGTATTQDTSSLVDNAGFTDGTSRVLPPGYVFDEVAGTALTENDIAAARIDAKRAQVLVLEDATTRGQRAAVSAGGAVSVAVATALPAGTNNIGDVDIVTDATQVTEDAVAASNPAGPQLMARARSVPLSAEVPAADHVALNANRLGALFVNSPNSTVTGQATSATTIVTVPCEGMGLAVFELAGTWVATIVFEGTVDGASWFSVQGFAVATDASVTGATANGQWRIPLSGLAQVRARASAYTSGTVFANASASNGSAIQLATQAPPGTGATSLGKAEDAPAGSGDTGVAMLAVRRDTPGTGIGADGDYAFLEVDSTGSVRTAVQGRAAHDATAAGNPVLVGGVASSTRPTAVSSGDAAQVWADLHGSPIVLLGGPNALTTRGLTNFTTNTAADVIAAAGAGVKIAVMGILVTNAHATVATKVSIRDDATVKVTGYAPAAGGGFVISGSTPIFTTTANAPVRAVCGTTGADVDVNVWGYLTV